MTRTCEQIIIDFLGKSGEQFYEDIAVACDDCDEFEATMRSLFRDGKIKLTRDDPRIGEFYALAE